jgi:hypothetical protein
MRVVVRVVMKEVSLRLKPNLRLHLPLLLRLLPGHPY